MLTRVSFRLASLLDPLTGSIRQPGAEIILPTFGKGCNLQGSAHYVNISIVVIIREVQTMNFCNRDVIWVARNFFYFIACANLALARHGKVKARSFAGQETLHHGVGLKPCTPIGAKEAPDGSHNFCRTNRKSITEIDGTLQKAFGREILSKISQRQIAAGQLLLPIGIVLQWVAIHRFLGAPMHGEVCLSFTVEI